MQVRKTEEELTDLLRYCPRSVLALPKRHYLCPSYYKLDDSAWLQRDDFGEMLEYRVMGLETGPDALIKVLYKA